MEHFGGSEEGFLEAAEAHMSVSPVIASQNKAFGVKDERFWRRIITHGTTQYFVGP